MGAAALALDRGAWGGGGVHVPDPTDSGTVTTVDDAKISSTPPAVLRRVLAKSGRSLSQVAEEVGVSKQRASRWLAVDEDATINLGHILRAPSDVRRAIAAELTAVDEPRVVPMPLALYEKAVTTVLTKVAALTARVETLRETGDTKARNAALREISDLRAALDRIEAGVMLAAKGAR